MGHNIELSNMKLICLNLDKQKGALERRSIKKPQSG